MEGQFAGVKAFACIFALNQWDLFRLSIKYLVPKHIMKKRNASFHNHVKYIDERLARSSEYPDLWSMVQGHRSEEGLSKGEMHSNAVLFMLAGTETTATELSGLTFHLLKNPDKMKKVAEEIRSSFTNNDQITLDTLRRRPYLNACIVEGLRLYPPAPASE